MKYILALILLSVNNKEMKYNIIPSTDLNAIWQNLPSGGNVLEFADGDYKIPQQWYLTGKSGTTSSPILCIAKNPGKVNIRPAANYVNPFYRGGLYMSGNNIHWFGIRITGFAQRDEFLWNGMLWVDCNGCKFEQCSVDNSGGGLYVAGQSTDNQVINSDFYHNYDPKSLNNPGGNADGLNISAVAAGTKNYISGVRTWGNSDDGTDFYDNSGYVEVNNSWSFKNGFIPRTNTPVGNGQGYKLHTYYSAQSSFLRKLVNCIAFENKESGFHQEEATCRIELDKCASVNNGGHGILLNYQGIAHKVTNSYVYGNKENQAVITDQSVVTNCVSGPGYAGNTQQSNWPNTIKPTDFLSLSSAGADGPRKADGSLPDIPFLKTVPGKLVGIGPVRTGSTPPPAPLNLPPTANAGMDVEVTLMVPMEGMSLTGEGSDPEGGPLTYKWTDEKGNIISNTATVDLNNILTATGVYIFTFTVTDNQGLSASDDITVTVVDKMPVSANAGPDITTLLLTPVTIIGTATGAASFRWTAEDGTELSKSPTLSFTGFDTTGVNKFKLTVTDAAGKTATDEVIVTVKAAALAKKLFTAYVQDNTAKTLSKTKPSKVWKAVEYYDDKTIKEV